MESIRQAVERARTRSAALPAEQGRAGADTLVQEVLLDAAHLQSRRIISHDITDRRARSFDMLRTQVLQSMDFKGWRTLAVTSPTPGCGKTLTAVNLALSIARQPERSVLLVDLDFRKPQVAASLGLECDGGVLSVLQGTMKLSDAIIPARVANLSFVVLPTAATIASSELISSPAMAAMLGVIRNEYHSQIIILDLPPILSGDDVIAILPQTDCVLFVAAVGTTTVSQVKECNKHLKSAETVRMVLNKVPETSANYYHH